VETGAYSIVISPAIKWQFCRRSPAQAGEPAPAPLAGIALFVLGEKLSPAGHWIGKAAGSR
jgi:hypothetical protein